MSTETGAWMPIYWADYLGDTPHLTTEEHGAYLLLIGAYWRRGKPLPDDDAYLAAVTKLPKFRWKKTRETLLPFFEIQAENDQRVWVHKRLKKEISRSSVRLDAARMAGKASGKARARPARQQTTENETDDHAPKKKASRWNGSQVPEEWRTWAWEHSKVDVNLEAEKFTDHWISVPGQKGLKLNWEATWRNWIRRAGKFSGDQAPLKTDHL